jgi:hypothetical protein
MNRNVRQVQRFEQDIAAITQQLTLATRVFWPGDFFLIFWCLVTLFLLQNLHCRPLLLQHTACHSSCEAIPRLWWIWCTAAQGVFLQARTILPPNETLDILISKRIRDHVETQQNGNTSRINCMYIIVYNQYMCWYHDMSSYFMMCLIHIAMKTADSRSSSDHGEASVEEPGKTPGKCSTTAW